MAIYLHETFEGTAAGSVPASMTSTSMVVSSAVAFSGSNGMTVAVNSTQSSAWSNSTDSAAGDGRVRCALRVANTAQRIGIWMRHNGSAVASQTGYLLSLAIGGGAGNNGLNFYTCTAGSFVQLGAVDALVSSFSLGTWYAFDATMIGSALALGVQRLTDNLWLQADGSWSGTLARPVTRTDASISGVGRAGLEGFGSVDGLSLDELWFTDPADTSGIVGGGSFPAQQVVAGTSAAYLSTGNSSLDVSNAIEVIDNGWYCKFTFSGSALGLRMDMSSYVTAGLGAGTYGNFIVSVDGGSFTRVAVSGTPSSGILLLNLAAGLAAVSHTVEIIREIRDETDFWSPKDLIEITHFLINTSETLTAPAGVAAVRPKRALILGDSITQGYAASDTLSPFDYPPATFARMLLAGMNAEGTQCGRSGQGWIATSTPAGGNAFPATWNFYYSGKARVLSGFDYLFACHGTNDTANVTSTVQSWISSARAAVGSACWILLVAPFSGGSRTGEISAAVTAYNAANPSDTKVVFLDTATVLPLSSVAPPNAYKLDIHPTTLGHAWESSVLTGLASRLTSAAPLGVPVVTLPTPVNLTVGVAVNLQIPASNNPTSYAASLLPAGISLNTATGLITGAPTTVGTQSPVTISATNATGTGTENVAFVVAAAGGSAATAPTVYISDSETMVASSIHLYNIAAASNGAAITSYAATGLPSWATLNSSTGQLTLSPPANSAGSTTIGLTATNSVGTSSSVSLTLTVVPVGSSLPAPAYFGPAQIPGEVGQPFAFVLPFSHDPTGYAAGTLPNGLSLNTSTGLISGTPTTAGSSSVTFTATNSTGTGTTTATVAIAAQPSAGTNQLDLTQVLGSGAWAGANIGDALKAAWIQGKGRWVISGTSLILYAPDGITIEKSFTLDSSSSPTQRS